MSYARILLNIGTFVVSVFSLSVSFAATATATPTAAGVERLSSDRQRFSRALAQDVPVSARVWLESVVFSLRIGEGVLSYYEDQVAREGLNQVIFFEKGQDQKEFTYWQAVKEASTNTYFVIRLITSKYAGDSFVDRTLRSYVEILDQLRRRQAQLRKVREQVEECLSRQDLCQNPCGPSCDKSSLAAVHVFLHQLFSRHLEPEFLGTPFIKSVLKDGLYAVPEGESIAFPLIDDFEIRKISQFTEPELSYALLEQLNFLNVFMLVRGPHIVETFGRSAMGQMLLKRLGAGGAIAKIAKMPWPLNSAMMWLALETADGCVIRYAFLAYAVNQQVSPQSQSEIERYLVNRSWWQ